SGTLSATDAYGLPLTYSLVSNPGHGMLSNFDASTGAFTYTPVTDYLGSDSFKWKVTNGHATATSTANITVSNIPPPVASNGSVTTQENTPVNKTLTATGSGTLTFTIVDKPSHGTATITNAATGDFTYTPASGYTGNDSFTFTASNNIGSSNTATESVTVTASGGGTNTSGKSGGGALSLLGLGLLSLSIGWRRRRSVKDGKR
ncbi:MAG: Ig-like domain-containing protein, partial [Gammaproteobacteria bacterium]